MTLRGMLQAYMPGFLITHADASITAENRFRVMSSVSHAVPWFSSEVCVLVALGVHSRGPFQCVCCNFTVSEGSRQLQMQGPPALARIRWCVCWFCSSFSLGSNSTFLEITSYF